MIVRKTHIVYPLGSARLTHMPIATALCSSSPGALAAMSAFLDGRPHVGLAGPRLVYLDGRAQESVSHRYLGQKYAPELYRGLKGEIAWVMGACMIAPAGVVRDVGGFDERFFLYGEEEDLCLRIRQAGWEIGFAGEAVGVHVGGGVPGVVVSARRS